VRSRELPAPLLGIGQRIVEWFRRPEGAINEPPPYQVYVYPPRDEWEVRSQLNCLKDWLVDPTRAVPCAAVSLADVLWQAIDESGFADELFAQERAAAGNPRALAELHKAVAELLRAPVKFSDRVIAAVDAAGPVPSAVFLYRAGSLYPVLRTSGLLDDLRPKLRRPVTLLYPGVLEGEFGLRFMGKWEPTYNYRALIVDSAAADRTEQT
jgi:hypothetical protein